MNVCDVGDQFLSPLIVYTMAEYGVSMCVLGMAEEFKKDGVAVNALWPRTSQVPLSYWEDINRCI